MTKSKSSSRTPKSAPSTSDSKEPTGLDSKVTISASANESSTTQKAQPTAKEDLLDVTASPEEAESAPKSSRKQKLEFEGSMSRAEAFAQLEAIAKGLEKGSIELQAKGQTVELSPSHHFDLELKASTKGSKERISIELAWRADCEPEQKLKVIVDENAES